MRPPISLLTMLCALAFVLVTSAGVANAQPSKKAGRSLSAANANGTTLMLEEMRREDKKRRDGILRMELESERRERSDRVVIFGVIAIAVTAMIVVQKRRTTKKPAARA